MMPLLVEADSFARAVVVRLLDGSLQGALVVAFVWAVCATSRSLPAAGRAWLWWIASLKLVMALLAIPAIPIPVLPSTPHDAARSASERVVDTAALALPVDAIKQFPKAVLPPSATKVADSVGWRISALVLVMGIFVAWWAGVLAMQGVVLFMTHRQLQALVARAEPADEHSRDETRRLATLLKLRRVPEVMLSDEVSSPQVIGFRRPCVLLPAAMSSFSDEERRMMLCHELTHVRRRDLVLGWIPALAERAFFFHPLARFAAREYVLAREAACDASVLRALAIEPERYGRLLVRLGIYGSSPALTAPGASSTVSLLRRRLEMLHGISAGSGWRGRLWLAGVAIALAFVPIHLTARDVPDVAVEKVLPVARQAVRDVAAVVTPALTGPALPAEQTTQTSAVQTVRFGGKPSKQVAPVPPPASATADEPSRRSESALLFLVSEHSTELARLDALMAARSALLKTFRDPRSSDDIQKLSQVDAEIDQQRFRVRQLAAKVEDAKAAQQAQLTQAAQSLDSIRETQTTLRVLAEQTGGFAIVNQEDFNREISRLSAYLREVERAQAKLNEQAPMDEIQRTLEQLAARQAALAAQTADVQRRLAERYTATHPERQSVESQLKMLQAQTEALAAAGEHLTKQRQLLNEAQRRLAEAEEQLREAAKAVTAPAR